MPWDLEEICVRLLHRMGWITVPNSDSSAFEAAIERSLDQRIQSGTFSIQDVKNIRDRELDLIPKDLELNNELLLKLRRLCQLWQVDIRTAEISSHRPIIGPIIVGVKKVLFPMIRFALKDLIREQRDFNAEVISYLATLSQQQSDKRKQ